jgi:hypothetical protein
MTITDQTIFYILCPANSATGGPEALHQLGAELKNQGKTIFMYYYDYNKKKQSNPIHKNYLHYEVPYVLDVENSDNNVMVLPETQCILLWKKKYSKLQKIVWWLSVTNFNITLDIIQKRYEKKSFFFIKKWFKDYPIPSIENVGKAKVLHMAHSYFSIDFLKQNNIPIIGQLSDYMNDRFLSGKDFKSQKENTIIYNPVKNGPFLEKIKAITPDLNWFAIERNLTPEEVLEAMKKAKVYIDFGYHPGKEKMPRESCLMDCCLIVGKDGSAKFKEDMPILDEYHFEKKEKNSEAIASKVRSCLINYDEHIKDFENYKQVLLNEKKVFINTIKTLFQNQN